MITRELKLKLRKKQEDQIGLMFFQCTGLYNLIIRRIELSAKDKIYYSKYELFNQFTGHSKRTDLHSRTIQATIEQAHNAWNRCFKKLGGKPKLKSVRNKLNSVSFPDPVKTTQVKNNTVKLPSLGELRFFKQEIPDGKIKCSRIIKKASGYYLQITIDTNHIFPVKVTEEKVGIDTGFKHLAILSNGKKYDNERNFVKSQKRLAQAQRGNNKKLVARLHEKISNRRKDYNHKISKEIVQNFKKIYITNDNLRRQSKIFGKSVSDAGISQLRNFIFYKSENHSRKCDLVNSKKSTMTCGKCWAITGPTGLRMLNVRNWECSACGAVHDRDINSACVTLGFGLGINLVPILKSV
jgi:transposase